MRREDRAPTPLRRALRADEFGYRRLIARVTAGDAAWIDAMVDRVADILARDPRTRPQPRRAALAGHGLARPAGRPVAAAARPHRARPTSRDPPTPSRTTDAAGVGAGPPGPSAGRSRPCPPASSPPSDQGPVFVHLTDAALPHRTAWPGSRTSARSSSSASPSSSATPTSGSNPSATSPRRFGSTDYEHPDALKDHIWKLAGGDAFPLRPAPPTAPSSTSTTPRRTTRRATGPDRHPQLRPAATDPSPLEDLRRLPLPTSRPRPLPVANPARALLPARPHRHPPTRPRRRAR